MGFLEQFFTDIITNEGKKQDIERQRPRLPSKQTAQCVKSTAGRDNTTNSYTVINEIHYH